MLWNAIVQRNLTQEYNRIYDYIWSGNPVILEKTASEYTLAQTDPENYTITTATNSFSASMVGNKGAIVGFLPFEITEYTDEKNVKIKILYFPVEITSTIFSEVVCGDLCIGGYSAAIASAFQSLVSQLIVKKLFPEAMLWISRQQSLMKRVQIALAFENIFRQMFREENDKWFLLMEDFQKSAKEILNSATMYYNSAAEDVTNEIYETKPEIELWR